VALEGKCVKAQSRHQFITQNSTIGFGKMVAANEDYFKSLLDPPMEPHCNKIIIFGEYCGPKIQKGVSAANLPFNFFGVFAIDIGGQLIIEPQDIQDLMTKGGRIGLPPHTYILP